MGAESLRHHTGLTEPAAAFFERNKARMLGVASNSFVFADPQNSARVIKLSLKAEDGWCRWATWCTRSYRERWGLALPRIYGVSSVGGATVAHLERLDPLPIGFPARAGMRTHKRDPIALAGAIRAGIERDNSVSDLLIYIHTIFPDASWDLGPTNWMVRPETGALILNDPISHMLR